mmetsp:Transcript_12652/g.46725  ORF Transcript_12652/g.46725 Transcript_12652/m.46725 type:complete len:281 (+) Transcript_12652:377-1219(+)
MFQRHVVFRRKPYTGTEDIDHALALGEKGVQNRSSLRNQRCLEKVGQQRDDGVEAFLFLALRSDLDPLAELHDHHQIIDQGRRQQGVFAGVVQDDRVRAAHEDLRGVLVHRSLRVTHVGNILDDYSMVGMLVLVVQDPVRRHHVVHHIRFRDLLGAEGLRRTEIASIIVSQVVVRHDGDRLDARIDEEVHQHAFHLRLPGLEVVAGDVDLVPLGQLDDARHEGVLGRAIDVRAALQDRRDGEKRRRADLGVATLDRLHQHVSCVILPGFHGREALRVGSP